VQIQKTETGRDDLGSKGCVPFPSQSVPVTVVFLRAEPGCALYASIMEIRFVVETQVLL